MCYSLCVRRRVSMFVINRDKQEMEDAGFAKCAFVPFLIAADGTYPAEANRYLRSRANCEWEVHLGGAAQLANPAKKRFLTPKSCDQMARRLRQFLRWCIATDRDWRTIDYREDLMDWQKGLVRGTASESLEPLADATINGLISEACLFLTWAGERTYRAEFDVPTNICPVNTGRGNGAKSHKQPKDIQTRVGALVGRPSKLKVPSPTEVGRWMRAMRHRYPVKSMMAELIIETGIRISECNQWRIDTLPLRDKWEVRGGMVQVTIRYGIKGPKRFPGSEESVNHREILVPVELADRMDRYREVTRLNQLRRWVRAGEDKDEQDRRARAPKPDRLFLSESSNQPFENVQLYRAWTQTPGCPNQWHPHSGRAYFAIEMVVEWVRNDLAARGCNALPELTWLQGAMRDQVRLMLTPLLGHVSDETTMLYLRGVHLRLVEEFGHPVLRWQAFCDQDAQF